MISLKYDLKLGSQSSRRYEILKLAGFNFEVIHIPYEEDFSACNLPEEDIPLFLAEQKALHAEGLLENDLLITADTLVFLDNKVLGKPADKAEALDMLQLLSGKSHKVITGVCLFRNKNEMLLFKDETRVFFKALDMKELEYYVDNYPVLDKAGAYGVQDWIGTIGIEKIEGNYYNVMGLPIQMVYEKLKVFANH